MDGVEVYLLDGVSGAAAGHDIGHHALKEVHARGRASIGGQSRLQRRPQQIRVELRKQLPVRLACSTSREDYVSATFWGSLLLRQPQDEV